MSVGLYCLFIATNFFACKGTTNFGYTQICKEHFAFFGKIIFPKKFPKSFSCRFRKKAVSLQQNSKNTPLCANRLSF